MSTRLAAWQHQLRLWWLGLGRDKPYRDYLRLQWERSFPRRKQPLLPRTQILADHALAGLEGHPGPILCVGCRSIAELDYFRLRGAERVVGIDLFSEQPDILVMDMHYMKFPDGVFDIVYAAHSLEHSRDVARVVREIVRVARPGARVAIEVPIRFETRGADLIDFQGVAGVHHAFGDHLGDILWSEEQAPQSAANEGGTAIARTVFLVRK